MSLAEFSVRRWQFTLVAFLLALAVGASSLFAIPKSEDPSFPFPNFAVVAVLPGANPSDIERLVVDPIEAKLQTLDRVKTLQTEIKEGFAVVRIEFEPGTDPVAKRDEVLRETTALRPTLPAEIAKLEVREFDAAKVNVIEVGLVSASAPYRELDRVARALERRLEGVAGVGDVEISGLPAQEVKVELDLDRMVELGISPGELIAAVGADGTNIPAGAVDAGGRQLSVKTSGDFASIDEIRATVVRTVEGRAVRVGDVAVVRQADAEASHFARVDGERAVVIVANQRSGQDIFAVSEGLRAALDAFERELPADVRLVRVFEQASNVEHRLGGFARDFGLAIALVLLTLLPLGWRASLVVMISIPLSLALGLAMLRLTGFSINQLSIVGFVIALGLLVDDSVVVVENISRFLREGHSPKEAAILATRQITPSVLGCTATLVLAFVPLLALPGAAGLFIRSLPVAVVFTIGASLLVSLTIVPFLASRLLVREGEHGNVVFRAMTWLIEGSYRRVLGRALARPKTALVVALGLFGASLLLVPHIGTSLFPKAGIPQFLVTIETPEGSSLEETDAAARWVEGVVRGEPLVRHAVTHVGKGNPRVYYNVGQREEQSNVAEIFAELDTRDSALMEATLGQLRQALVGRAGVRIQVREFENGPPVDAPIALRILGTDQAAIESVAARVEALLLATPGTRDVRDPSRDRKSDLRVRIDRDKAARLGVAVPDVDRAARLSVGGIVAGRYRDARADEAWDVRVVATRAEVGGDDGARGPLPGSLRPRLEVLDRTYVAAPGGGVPLAQVATLELEPSPTTLRHWGRSRSATVTSFVQQGYLTDRVTRQVTAAMASWELPEGVRIQVAGEAESRAQSFGGLGTAILVAIFGVLAVLVLEFRTFKGTVIVASVLPLGVVGGLVALFLGGYTLSFTATVGFIALMGIEVKNSILLVDFTNQLREEGLALDEAIEKAGSIRFVPILLTTLTAIGGLIPLVLERSALTSPLALVILGGLVSSTLLARVVTPVVYKLMAPELEAKDGAAHASGRAVEA